MKPIDALTGLPRSPDIARIAAAQGRHGETQSQAQVSLFSREMKQRETSVNETPKTEGARVDSESAGGGDGSSYSPDERRKGDGREEKQAGPVTHPSKGKFLDIKGS